MYRRGVSSKQSSSIINEKTCTIIVAVSLCVWLLGGIIYIISFNNSNVNDKTSTQAVIQSNTEYIPGKGWKPVYFEDLSVRMPQEEHQYILQRYWIPKMKELENKVDIDDNNGEIIEQENNASLEDEIPEITASDTEITEEAIEEETVVKKNHQNNIKKPPKLIKNINNNKNKKKSSTTTTLIYKWKNACIDDIHKEECVLKQMKYWVPGITQIHSTPIETDKYVTFLTDCGGFNNIRQGFEFHVMVAWITNRTLVIPPDKGWYLIDFGHITRGKLNKKDKILGHPEWKIQREKGVSNFDIFFNINDMRKAVNVITTQEFIKRNKDTLDIPHKFINKPLNKVKDAYIDWLNKKSSELNVNLPWGQLANVVMWPSIKAVDEANNPRINRMFIDNRNKVEYTPYLKEQTFIHFPACKMSNPSTDGKFRYLGQIARSIAFKDDKMDRKYKQVLRDHCHLNDIIMEYASKVVSILGAYNYISLHIRRNDLQYKYVWSSPEDSYNNILPLIGKNETMYISTDETREDFFDVFKDGGNRKVYRWYHFFGKNAIFEETKDIYIPNKIHGEVEMAIAAMSRIFFGTKESTFSSYIGRLRGYFNAPNTQTLYHHSKCTENIDKSSQVARSNPGKPYAGQIYKIPFPDLWEDIRGINQFLL